MLLKNTHSRYNISGLYFNFIPGRGRRSTLQSCGLMYKDFLLKHGVRSKPNALLSTKISGCMNLCVRMNPSTFPLYIPINVELNAHVGVLLVHAPT